MRTVTRITGRERLIKFGSHKEWRIATGMPRGWPSSLKRLVLDGLAEKRIRGIGSGPRFYTVTEWRLLRSEQPQPKQMNETMHVVYKTVNGRMISIDLDKKENILRDEAELMTSEQAGARMESDHSLKVMSEDEWFSY